MNKKLYKENIFRKCIGDRDTTRNVLDTQAGQIILVRRGLKPIETNLLVSMILQKTEK